MADQMPAIVASGASGVVGRHFLEMALDHYRIFALARRSQSQAGIEPHPNLTWIQVDVGNWPAVKAVTERIAERGGADFTLHLAAHYDFSNRDHPEYLRTNVNGTRHMLEQAKRLCVKRFVFASSIAACSFPRPGGVVNEDSAAAADYPYATSKRRGERLVREYSRWYPCSIVRLAAVFSDWCEYPPLFVFLDTWLSRRWNARILAGRGTSAVTYIHVFDLNRLFLAIMRDSDALPTLSTYVASPNGCTTHRELFKTATRFYFGSPHKPVLMPKPIALAGVMLRDLAGRMVGRRPFERAWMLRYADRLLEVDSSRTQALLGWHPTPRYQIARRMLFLVENMRGDPHIWHARNEAVLSRRLERPNLAIYDALAAMRERLVREIVEGIGAGVGKIGAGRYRSMDRRELEWSVGILYRLLMAAVRTGDRALLLQYANDLARRRFEEGFHAEEVQGMLALLETTVINALETCFELRAFGDEIHHTVTLSIQMAMDEIEESFDTLAKPEDSIRRTNAREAVAELSRSDLERIIAQLGDFDRPWNEPFAPTQDRPDQKSEED